MKDKKVIQKKKPKHTLEERGIFVRKPESFDEVIEKNQVLADQDFYQEIWEEREHKCFESGKLLPSEPLSLFFHHILPKAKYPQYRHAKWNIVILHPDVHSQVEVNLDKCPRVKGLTEHLKNVYG